MKIPNHVLATVTAALLAASALGQETTPGAALPAPSGSTAKFDLDFPGGTPKQLVAAIEKATHRPVNVIVPEDANLIQLPAVKVSNVDLAQLLPALNSIISPEVKQMVIGGVLCDIQCAFEGARITNLAAPQDSVWALTVRKRPHPSPARACRFYSLAACLERGLTVDDITTAIETGWKMLGASPTPEISFHKDTKLLIAVGEPSMLEVIDDVLKALSPRPSVPSGNFQERLRAIPSRAGAPDSPATPGPAGQPEKPKTDN